MFDLEAAISRWRRDLQAQWKGEPSALAELEDHLREEVAALVGGGQGEQEAWRLATSKLGDAATIRKEFAKIERLAGVDRLALGTIVGVAALAIACLQVFLVARRPEPATPVLTIHVAAITTGYLVGLAAAAVAGYGAVRGLIARAPLPVLQGVTLQMVRLASVVAAACTAIGLVLGAVWANRAWGRPLGGDPRELGAMLVIAVFAAIVLTGWRGVMSARVSQAIAISGGGIILAAWFGAAAQAAGDVGLLAAIGFGGLVASLGLAALSLAVREAPTSQG